MMHRILRRGFTKARGRIRISPRTRARSIPRSIGLLRLSARKLRLPFKRLINDLSSIESLSELNQYAYDNNIQDLAFLRRAWKGIRGIFKPIVQAGRRILQPVIPAIQQRAQQEVEQAGHRLAQQIYPAGYTQPQPQVVQPIVQTPVQTGVGTFNITRYLPFIIGGVVLLVVLKSKKQEQA